MSRFREYGDYDGLGLAQLVQRGDISAAELLEEAILRVERVNPRLNGVVHKMYERARRELKTAAPSGPLAGVPTLIRNPAPRHQAEPALNGSRSFAGHLPDRDSELIRRLRQAGLVPLALTNTQDFGLSRITEPGMFGPTRNPWDMNRTCGGSSGGSSAMVAARAVPIAGVGDGSIRISASCCGLVGLKPTHGRNPANHKHGPIEQGVLVEHVVTRSVRDSAAVLDATQGVAPGTLHFTPSPSRPYLQEIGAKTGRLRIAYSIEALLGTSTHPECIAGVARTLQLLRELGHEIVEDAPRFERNLLIGAFLTSQAGEIAATLTEAAPMPGRPGTGDADVLSFARIGAAVRTGDFVMASHVLKREIRKITAFNEHYDAWLTPTLAGPPARIGDLASSPMDQVISAIAKRIPAISRLLANDDILRKLSLKLTDFCAVTPIQSIAGQPSISLPLHWSEDGLPIGMMFSARHGDEATLFRLAAQLEQAQPWASRVPAIDAQAPVHEDKAIDSPPNRYAVS